VFPRLRRRRRVQVCGLELLGGEDRAQVAQHAAGREVKLALPHVQVGGGDGLLAR
jgi:hypothetical protein